jgi:hypothetical protein
MICIRRYFGDHITEEDMDETCYTGRWGEKCLQNFGPETLREDAGSRTLRLLCVFMLFMRQLKAVFKKLCDVISQ